MELYFLLQRKTLLILLYYIIIFVSGVHSLGKNKSHVFNELVIINKDSQISSINSFIS